MNVCIIYDTKREKGATKHIVNWMVEGVKITGVKVDVKRPSEIKNFDYDLFVIGSPIYYERPMKSVVNFLSSNQCNFKDKKVAIFIVCLAQIFGKHTEKYVKNHYLEPLEEKISSSLVKSGVFKGWLRNPNYRQREMCIEWIREMVKDARE